MCNSGRKYFIKSQDPCATIQVIFWCGCPTLEENTYIGRIGIIAKIQKKIKAKLDNRGSSCIFVGYYTTCEIDVFRFYDTKTKHIRLSRNVTWLDKNYGTSKGLKTNNIKLEEDSIDDPVEFGRDDKIDFFLTFNQMSNQ